MKKKYNIIVIGAGSVGTPAAYYLAREKYSVLVIEKEYSPGRGQNRAAIGGVRATHSDFAKIRLGLDSIQIFSSFHSEHGIDIDWFSGGYLYPIYTESDKKNVLDLLKIQQSYGLNIDWIDAEKVKNLVPGITSEKLLGGIYSPEDGNASPLKSNYGFYKIGIDSGVDFLFNTKVKDLLFSPDQSRITGVKTDSGEYECDILVNAAGIGANDFHSENGIMIPLKPDCHEAGITEPVEKIFDPMVVDIRIGELSRNFYFYQNNEGQIIFCLTPEPPIYCNKPNATADFLPLSGKRFLDIMPGITDIRIRRTWRGYYPNTPDGLPIVDKVNDNYYLAVGMCGQGYMFGPATASLLAREIVGKSNENDRKIMKELTLKRSFNNIEFFK